MLGFLFGSKKYKSINAQEFKDLQKEKNTIVLDVRSTAEIKEGAVKGNRQMNVMDPSFRNKASKLDKSKTYLVYCRSGMRSARACKMLAKEGIENIYNLKGGYMAYERD
ncbi:MAG: rhodanese-like domain-containing protein [Cyclobacteriaceae bacterium]